MRNIFNNIIRFDNNLALYFNKKCNNKYLVKFLAALTRLAQCGIYAVIIFAILFFIPNTRIDSYLLGFSILLNTIVVNVLIKNIIKRKRPYQVNKEINILTKLPSDYSFPSGHTSVTAAATIITIYYGVIYNLGAVYIIVNIIFLVLMGFSRIYLRVHYFTDVICGLIIGIINGIITLIFKDYIIRLGSYAYTILESII